MVTMSKLFKDDLAQTIFNGAPLTAKQVKAFPKDLYQAARIALVKVKEAGKREDLYVPPTNKFHALTGRRAGEYAITIKKGKPWRVVFAWGKDGPYDITIEDYHN